MTDALTSRGEAGLIATPRDATPWDGSQGAGGMTISAVQRAALLGHRSAIVWLTGLSGAGKTTLARGLEGELFRARVLPAVVDGDILRAGLSRGLGFTVEDRMENMRRAAEAALLLAEGGFVAVVALISPFRAARAEISQRAREKGVPFAEVYVNASLAECERRDPKSLYKKARAGEIPAFTGIDSPYEVPLSPDLELRTDRESVDESLAKLTRLTLNLAGVSARAFQPQRTNV